MRHAPTITRDDETATVAPSGNLLTLGQAADQLGCKTWQLQAAFDRGLLGRSARAGAARRPAAGPPRE
jgi:hypothetical protein